MTVNRFDVKLVCKHCGYEFVPFFHPREKWVPTSKGIKGYVLCSRCGWIPAEDVVLIKTEKKEVV